MSCSGIFGGNKPIIYCKEHEDEEVKRYCKTCSDFVCMDCILDGHKGHTIIRVKELASTKKDDIVALVDKVRNNYLVELRGRIQHNRQAKRLNKQCIVECQKRMARHAASIRQYLDKLRNNTVSELKEIQKYEMERQEELVKYLVSEEKTLVSLLKAVEKSVNSENPQEMIQNGLALEDAIIQLQQCPPSNIELLEFYTEEQIQDKIADLFGYCRSREIYVEIPEDGRERVTKMNAERLIEISTLFKLSDEPINSIAPIKGVSYWVNCTGSKKIQQVVEGQVKKTEEIDSAVIDICFTKERDIIVALKKRFRLLRIRPNGQKLDYIDTKPLYPNGLHVGRDGYIYMSIIDNDSTEVTKESKRAVIKYSNTGSGLQKFAKAENGDRLYTLPRKLVINSTGDICTIDATSLFTGRVVTVRKAGELKYIYNGREDLDLQEFNPTAIACDSHDRVIISDFDNCVLHLLNTDGQLVHILRSDATETSLYGPFALAVDKTDAIWIGTYDGIIMKSNPLAAPRELSRQNTMVVTKPTREQTAVSVRKIDGSNLGQPNSANAMRSRSRVGYYMNKDKSVDRLSAISRAKSNMSSRNVQDEQKGNKDAEKDAKLSTGNTNKIKQEVTSQPTTNETTATSERVKSDGAKTPTITVEEEKQEASIKEKPKGTEAEPKDQKRDDDKNKIQPEERKEPGNVVKVVKDDSKKEASVEKKEEPKKDFSNESMTDTQSAPTTLKSEDEKVEEKQEKQPNKLNEEKKPTNESNMNNYKETVRSEPIKETKNTEQQREGNASRDLQQPAPEQKSQSKEETQPKGSDLDSKSKINIQSKSADQKPLTKVDSKSSVSEQKVLTQAKTQAKESKQPKARHSKDDDNNKEKETVVKSELESKKDTNTNKPIAKGTKTTSSKTETTGNKKTVKPTHQGSKKEMLPKKESKNVIEVDKPNENPASKPDENKSDINPNASTTSKLDEQKSEDEPITSATPKLEKQKSENIKAEVAKPFPSKKVVVNSKNTKKPEPQKANSIDTKERKRERKRNDSPVLQNPTLVKRKEENKDEKKKTDEENKSSDQSKQRPITGNSKAKGTEPKTNKQSDNDTKETSKQITNASKTSKEAKKNGNKNPRTTKRNEINTMKTKPASPYHSKVEIKDRRPSVSSRTGGDSSRKAHEKTKEKSEMAEKLSTVGKEDEPKETKDIDDILKDEDPEPWR